MFDYSDGEVHAYLDVTKKPFVLRERETGRRIRFQTVEELMMDPEELEDPDEVMKSIIAATEANEKEYPGICARDGEHYMEISFLAIDESDEEIVIGLDDMFFGFGYYRYDFDE